MFSGIIEALIPTISCEPLDRAIRLAIQRPADFADIKNGDSIALDGVCLTVENFDSQQISFVVGFESLTILGWTADWMLKHLWNVERSLRVGDRLHGHFVTGHVDSRARLLKKQMQGECLLLDFEITEAIRPYVWKKGSIALNGVSLTINSIESDRLSVCLIPETIQRTNLKNLAIQDYINMEPDMMARALIRALELKEKSNEL